MATVALFRRFRRGRVWIFASFIYAHRRLTGFTQTLRPETSDFSERGQFIETKLPASVIVADPAVWQPVEEL
jgi:hypothetical protein